MRYLLIILIILYSCSVHKKGKFYKDNGKWIPQSEYGTLKEKL